MAIMPESKVKGGGRLRNDRNGQCWSNLINSACFAPLALPSLHWTNPENFPQQRNLPGSKDITRTPTTFVPKPWSCLHRVIFRTYAWFEMLERTFWCNQFSSRSSAAKVQLDLWNTAAAVLSDLALIGSCTVVHVCYLTLWGSWTWDTSILLSSLIIARNTDPVTSKQSP